MDLFNRNRESHSPPDILEDLGIRYLDSISNGNYSIAGFSPFIGQPSSPVQNVLFVSVALSKDVPVSWTLLVLEGFEGEVRVQSTLRILERDDVAVVYTDESIGNKLEVDSNYLSEQIIRPRQPNITPTTPTAKPKEYRTEDMNILMNLLTNIFQDSELPNLLVLNNSYLITRVVHNGNAEAIYINKLPIRGRMSMAVVYLDQNLPLGYTSQSHYNWNTGKAVSFIGDFPINNCINTLNRFFNGNESTPILPEDDALGNPFES